MLRWSMPLSNCLDDSLDYSNALQTTYRFQQQCETTDAAAYWYELGASQVLHTLAYWYELGASME
jgi:hypothetical protein